VRILVIDNYDSFTYNLVQYLDGLGAEVSVARNDTASPAELARLAPEGVVVSPGPGEPRDAGSSLAAVRDFAERWVPVLGVCLGHQALAVAFGGRVRRARRPMHGRTSPILHDGQGVFRGLPSPFDATRYHSLVVDEATLPAALQVSARTPDREIMGLRHRDLPAEGVQFHPESILTAPGRDLLANFLDRCRAAA
jgi:anthranilate synthase/aminodeoxychorismate synthase-like glutamine amidotransferase